MKFIVFCLVVAAGQMGLTAENASAVNKTGKVKEDKEGASVVRTFHIGNRLTDTVNGRLAPVAESAGRKLDFHRFTIPGSPTDLLWKHPGSVFADNLHLTAKGRYLNLA